ncbi:MAG: hypothetical protein KBD63_04760, partial [Bacteriovoracaceae bacterium]|nr:hypothetical protein [Bacteriovoracaceae bacterium]
LCDLKEFSLQDHNALESLYNNTYPHAPYHSEHKMNFFRSRFALRESLKRLDYSLDYDVLVLQDFHFLKKFPEIKISVSHTQECAMSLVTINPLIKSLGCDIEKKLRPYSSAIEKKIGAKTLEEWTLKEACYKALTLSHKTVMAKDIELKNNSFHYQGTRGEIVSLPHSTYFISIAFIF